MPTGLIRRNGRYSTRRRVPLDLVQQYDGKGEIVRALGTADRDEARRLHARMWVALDDEFAAAREQATATAANPGQSGSVAPSDVHARTVALLDDLRGLRNRWAAAGQLPEFIEDQLWRLEIHESFLSGEEPTSRSLDDAEVSRNAIRALLMGDRAVELGGPAPPRSAAGHSAPSGEDVPFERLIAIWEGARTRPPKTVQSMRRVFKRFEAATGITTVQAVKRRDITAFKDKMRESGQSVANINVMLTFVSALFGLAVERELIESNPASNSSLEDSRRAREKRREFDSVALAAIFGSPVYSTDLRPKAGAGIASYWVPLLGLYTGARINEICQLHPENVGIETYWDGEQTEQTAWVIRIEENAARGQRVKTEGSERRIPVHPDLVSLGFLEVVAAAKARGSSLLFPALRSDSDGKISGNWSKWFSRYLRETCKVTDKRMVFHSFRHTFKHFARLASIPTDVHNALTGHETGDTADDYGALSYPLAPLVEGMHRYRVPGFTLPARPRELRK